MPNTRKSRIEDKYSRFVATSNNAKHDQFFKYCLENKHIRRDFLDKYLPDEVRNYMNTENLSSDNLNIIPTENIPAELVGDTRADVLLQSNISPFLILHIEHQSSKHNTMLLRMMKYKTAIIENHQKQPDQENSYPTIFQMVYYNGTQDWDSHYEYHSTAKGYSIEKLTFTYHSSDKFNLVSLQKENDKIILDKEKPDLALMEYLMKYIGKHDLLPFWETANQKLDNFAQNSIEFIKVALHYTAKKLSIRESAEKLQKMFDEGINKAQKGGEMLTLADMILDDKTVIEKKARTEGRAEGKVEGKAEGIAEGISVALKYAPDANLQEDFHITQEQENKIKQLEQQPPAASEVERILLSDWQIESHSHQQDTELLGTDSGHVLHDS